MGTVLSTAIVLTMPAACARPGDTPEGHSEASVISGSAEAQATLSRPDVTDLLTPAPAGPSFPPGATGTVACAQQRMTVAKPGGPVRVPPPARAEATAQGGQVPVPPPAGDDEQRDKAADEAAERARRALEQPPLPRLGPVSEAAAWGAEACARELRTYLTLRRQGPGGPGPVTEAAVRDGLTSAGLLAPEVRTDRFAGSTGAACVVGVLVDGEPALSIAPLPAGGICAP